MRPTITILDGYTTSPLLPGQAATANDPSWQPVEALGELTIYPRTGKSDIVSRAGNASIVLTNKTSISAATIAALPELKYIGLLATGVNIVDVVAAAAHHVAVANVPGYSSQSVAQHVFALLLELTNHVAAHDRLVHAGGWTASADFSFTVAPLSELAGRTLGIVGLGDIGKRVAIIGHALGMNIAAAHQSSMGRVHLPGIEIDWQPLEALLAKADVLTLHCPLTEKTHYLMNAERLVRLKPGAIIINTGRGALIDESALAAALADGSVAAAGLDVLTTEPPNADNPLLTAPNCVITPHIAWVTRQARTRLIGVVAENIRSFLDGGRLNRVDSDDAPQRHEDTKKTNL